jgi:hypothetical protein
MKVLVAAKALDVNRTSEGICSSKFVAALSRAGHDVVCITAEASLSAQSEWSRVAWLDRALVRHISAYSGDGAWPRGRALLKSMARGSAGTYAVRKINASLAYGTGYDSDAWTEVTHWRTALQTALRDERPDIAFIRAAGSEFHPHLAMLNVDTAVPWAAHYHDPFPLSLYPAPYRTRYPFIAGHQERLHRRILERASALTFPSRRLLKWVLSGQEAPHQTKGFVLPHLAMALAFADSASELPDSLQLSADRFNLVHTGTLLGPRNPGPLVSAFRAFVGDDACKRRLARLTFVGSVNRAHAQYERSVAADGAHIEILNQRISYQQSLQLIRAATAAVVLEAGSESPFFPAKLADYLWLNKPILALSPRNSVASDLLGSEYPLLVAPDDEPGIARALDHLWQHWRSGRMNRLQPAADCQQLGEAAVHVELNRVFQAVSVH